MGIKFTNQALFRAVLAITVMTLGATSSSGSIASEELTAKQQNFVCYLSQVLFGAAGSGNSNKTFAILKELKEMDGDNGSLGKYIDLLDQRNSGQSTADVGLTPVTSAGVAEKQGHLKNILLSDTLNKKLMAFIGAQAVRNLLETSKELKDNLMNTCGLSLIMCMKVESAHLSLENQNRIRDLSEKIGCSFIDCIVSLYEVAKTLDLSVSDYINRVQTNSGALQKELSELVKSAFRDAVHLRDIGTPDAKILSMTGYSHCDGSTRLNFDFTSDWEMDLTQESGYIEVHIDNAIQAQSARIKITGQEKLQRWNVVMNLLKQNMYDKIGFVLHLCIRSIANVIQNIAQTDDTEAVINFLRACCNTQNWQVLKNQSTGIAGPLNFTFQPQLQRFAVQYPDLFQVTQGDDNAVEKIELYGYNCGTLHISETTSNQLLVMLIKDGVITKFCISTMIATPLMNALNLLVPQIAEE